jgi:hypothetical protein
MKKSKSKKSRRIARLGAVLTIFITIFLCAWLGFMTSVERDFRLNLFQQRLFGKFPVPLKKLADFEWVKVCKINMDYYQQPGDMNGTEMYLKKLFNVPDVRDLKYLDLAGNEPLERAGFLIFMDKHQKFYVMEFMNAFSGNENEKNECFDKNVMLHQIPIKDGTPLFYRIIWYFIAIYYELKPA